MIPREVGPTPAKTDAQLMKLFRLRKSACYCGPCRAANPIKDAIWRKDVESLRRSLTRADGDVVKRARKRASMARWSGEPKP